MRITLEYDGNPCYYRHDKTAAKPVWYARVVNADDADDEPLFSDAYGSHREALTAACDEAFIRGAKIVEIRDETYLYTHRLRSSPRRKILLEKDRVRLEDLRLYAERQTRYRVLAKEIEERTTPAAIIEFLGAWKNNTGYLKSNSESLAVLAPGKNALVAKALTAARNNGWEYGSQRDVRAQNAYGEVLYIDTPHGQASFHILPGSLGFLPPYLKPWSGIHNTAQVLAQVCDYLVP
jgi:hypothetical protein